MAFVIQIGIFFLIFCILSVSLGLVVGHCGILAMSHGAFYGIGAYCSALVVMQLKLPFGAGVAVGILLAVIVSFLISLSSLRLRDDYFVIATFAFQIVLYGIFNNWTELTRGPLGISDIPYPGIFGWRIDTQPRFFVLALGFAAFAYFVVYLLTSSPFGRVLHAIRENETFAKAHGKNTLYFKIAAFAVSAAFAASAGSLYAHYVTYIDPTSFTAMESILIISMVIIGGAGSLWGPLVGAFVLVILPEVLRFIGLPSAVAANLRQIIYGSLLVIMMMFRPRGLVGKYSFAK
jgi:branched-chain amino acid transport system permease protein